MAASFSNNHLREGEWFSLAGQSGVVYEQSVYGCAQHFTRDDETESIRRYTHGCWILERFEIEPAVYFWFRLESDARFRFVNADNCSDEVIDARLLSMVANLYASSHMCFHLTEQHEQARRNKKSQVILDRISQRNEYFAELHHAIKDHFLTLLGENSKKTQLLLQLID